MSKSLPSKRVQFGITQFEQSLLSLKEAVNETETGNKFLEDATIQRFEYTYETAWRAVKYILEDKGVYVNFPTDIFSEAFSAGWFLDAEIGKSMVVARNLTSHNYSEKKAHATYLDIKNKYYDALTNLLEKLKVELKKNDKQNEQDEKGD